MAWCEVADVNKRLESLVGKGYDDDDVATRIARAENELKSKLLGAYVAATVSGWDDPTPAVINNMCADVAALKIKTDFIDDYKLNDTEKSLLKWINDIIKGYAELMADDGTMIARSTHRTKFSRGTTKTPVFSIGNAGDDSWGEGTLDRFGPDQEDHEGDVD